MNELNITSENVCVKNEKWENRGENEVIKCKVYSEIYKNKLGNIET